MTDLLLGLLKMSLAPVVLIVLVAVGQFLAIALWDWMFVREERRADRVEVLPANVYDLAEWRQARGLAGKRG